VRLSAAAACTGALLVGIGVALPGAATAAGAAAGTTAYDCTDDVANVGQKPAASLVPSKPLQLMGVDRAAALMAAEGRSPGQGVKVAVLDSGVLGTSPFSPITVEHPATYPGVGGPIEYSHGTMVASLVAGHPQGDGLAVGVAPAATIVDLPVYRTVPSTATGAPARGIQVGDVVTALHWLDQHAKAEGIGVVVIALQLDGTPELRQAIHALARPANDVVIVAASGNRPSEGDPLTQEFPQTPRPGEDARSFIFPAGYTDDVIAVSASADGVPVSAGTVADQTATVLFNSATDVAAPTAGAVVVDGTGTTCVLPPEVQTSWATGLVGGVVALLRSAFPDETAAQVETRLVETADGRADETDRLYGAGTVQPVDALTRVLQMSRSGTLESTTSEDRRAPTVRAPEPRPDPLTGIRRASVWWGLLGGAALVVTALVRPIISRRRTSQQ
jgi:membrane-anchored mycosin MYCP